MGGIAFAAVSRANVPPVSPVGIGSTDLSRIEVAGLSSKEALCDLVQEPLGSGYNPKRRENRNGKEHGPQERDEKAKEEKIEARGAGSGDGCRGAAIPGI